MMKTGCTGTERPKNGTGGLRRVVLALAVLLLTCVLMAGAVSAEDLIPVGNWDELKDNLTAGKNITLCKDVKLEGVLTLESGDLVLDLGSHTLSNTTSSAPRYPILIKGGNLTIRGPGTIEYPTDLIRLQKGTVTIESGTLVANGDGSVVGITGSDVPSAKRYSNLIVGKDAVLKGGHYAAFISYDSSGKNFGITMDISGKLTSCEKPTQGGALHINGQLQGKEIIANPPVITIRDTAEIAPSKGNAVYAAGYGEWIIEGGKFEGTEALSIKSGNWTIRGGTFTGNGPFFDPAESNGNGSEPTGAAVSVTTNHGYAKNVSLTITGGTFHSTNQSAFYEGENTEFKGTALKGVKISGGNFTTNNATLSAVTIHNSGNESIKGISITDAAGNNLLYRGVNLTNVADWTGDATNGYTLSITAPGSYKLMDDVTISSMKVDAAATINGNEKTLTLSGTKQGVITVDNGAILQNLHVVAAKDATFGTAIKVNSGSLTGSTIDLTNQNAQSSTGRMSAIAVFVVSGEISDNTIQAGNSATSSSQCVVVNGDDVTVSGNTLTTGKSVQGTSGSVGIRLSGVSTTTTIADNHITSTKGAGLNNGIAADGVKNDVTITARGNTFDLATTNGGGAFYVNPTTDVSTVTINAEGNTVESAASFIYADKAEGAEAYTISGEIKNNDFAAADKGLVSADELILTLGDLEQSDNSGLITDPSEFLIVTPDESKITVTGAEVSQEDEDNVSITFTGYKILITNATVSGSGSEITYNDDSTATVTHKTVRHMGSSTTDIDVKLLITDMPKLAEISTPKAIIGDAEKAQLAKQKITPVSVVDIHHEDDEPGFDQITLTISNLRPSGKIIGFHVGKSGVDTSEVTIQGDTHVVTFTDLTSASPFGIGVISDGPQPPSSSSSGNMDNAYRVLFNDGSTTLSVQTDLSSGDKLTKPETPVKDGYTFAGWYKDSACTQAWDFETGISGDMTLYAKWTAAGSSGETEATATPTKTAVTTPQPTKTQSTTATTSAPEATTAAGVSPTLTQAPAPVAGALFGLLAAGVLLRRRFQ